MSSERAIELATKIEQMLASGAATVKGTIAPLLDQFAAESRIDGLKDAKLIAAKYSDSITSPFCEEKAAVADSMIDGAQVIENEIGERIATLTAQAQKGT